MREYVTAYTEAEAEDNGTPVEDQFIEFKLDGRTLRAYTPTEGQLAFMLTAFGRGQTDDQRYGSVLSIMLAVFRDQDKDWLESRLLSRDPAYRLPLAKLEEIFEDLIEEWFARPTQSPSDSAG